MVYSSVVICFWISDSENITGIYNSWENVVYQLYQCCCSCHECMVNGPGSVAICLIEFIVVSFTYTLYTVC